MLRESSVTQTQSHSIQPTSNSGHQARSPSSLMARPNQEAVDTFIGITGLPETLAVQILQEHGCDLNRAVNTHFNNGDRAFAHGTAVIAPQDDFMDVDEPVQADPHESSRNRNLPSLLNSDFRGRVFDGASEFTNHAPFVSNPSERRVIPIEVKNENGLPCQSGLPPPIDDVSGRPQLRRRVADDTILIDDEDDAADNVQPAPYAWDVHLPEPSAPLLNRMQEPDPDIEEEMIRAAIEASKREADRVYSSEPFGFHNGSEGSRSQFRDTDAQVASSSFEGAGQENLLREHVDHGKAEIVSPEDGEFQNPFFEDERLETVSSFIEGHTGILVNDTHHRQRSRHLRSGSVDSSTEVGEDVASPPLSQGPQQLSNTNLTQILQNANGFPADEWGGISSAEHDEAVMLEAAMFGGIPETSEYNAFAAHRIMQPNLNGNLGPHMRPEPHPPSPNLTAQRILREQQDDEYLASLQADIEKAEARRLEDQAARDAALEEQKRKEEESLRKLEEEQELERQLAAKEASIPQEPSPDDVNTVNLLVRMPDGSRRGRRFLKSDKLKSLFDYIDIGRVVKPDTYRLVRPYPWRAFGDGDSMLNLNELGLTSKQEALYLELTWPSNSINQ